MEEDLVTLIEKILETKLESGKNVSLISYNENRIKHIILNGITTISADFRTMGEKAAKNNFRRFNGTFPCTFLFNA